MKWSWKIARVVGIDVYVHTTFLILIAWIALAYWQLAGTLLAVVSGVSFILALFFCVLLHEFGHALTARKFNIRTRNITLLPIGGIASIEDARKFFLAGAAAVQVGTALYVDPALPARLVSELSAHPEWTVRREGEE